MLLTHPSKGLPTTGGPFVSPSTKTASTVDEPGKTSLPSTEMAQTVDGDAQTTLRDGNKRNSRGHRPKTGPRESL